MRSLQETIMRGFLVIFGVIFLSLVSGEIITTEDYPYSREILANGGYMLFWKFDVDTVTFEVHVQTMGWVGLGISPTGGMGNADIMIGWVSDDGTASITDRFATSNSFPAVDTISQDWHLLAGSETATHTMLKFWRYRNLCDNKDRNITTDGLYSVIWAYGQADPAEGQEPTYHQNRGTSTINLLDWEQDSVIPLPNDATPVDFLNPAVSVPLVDTMYWCQTFKLPEMETHHIVAVEPIITSGNVQLVHHMILRACYGQYEDSENGKGEVCPDEGQLTDCFDMLLTWAVGGTTQYFPEHVGYPLGGDQPPFWLMMETHYDNTVRQSGVVDSSGLRLWMTPTLREYDAGLLSTGIAVTENDMFLPPGMPEFRVTGHCLSSCLQQGLEESVQVFAVLLHTHTLGRSIRVRHFRDGIELPPILDDPNYDFNYQKTVRLPSEVTLMPDDHVQVECIYNTEDKDTVTVGGEGTYDEMCLAFLTYYPRQDLSSCFSTPNPAQLASIFAYTIDYDGSIVYPAEMAGMSLEEAFNGVDWSDSEIQSTFQAASNMGSIIEICAERDPDLGLSFDADVSSVPEIEEVYVPSQDKCYSGLESPSQDELTPTEDYPHMMRILEDDEYTLYWKSDTDSITFEVHARTTGWVGLGISQTGGMLDADIMVGWVSDGEATITDRFATGKTTPIVDAATQDYHLIYGYETDTHTVLKFWRYHLLCDEQDRDITSEQMYSVIWAYGAEDGDGNPAYHMSRGSISIDLLAETELAYDLPDDAASLDLVNNGVTVPLDPTLYWCQMFKWPAMEPHHIIGVEPIIAEGSEQVLHHMLLYACHHDISDDADGMSGECHVGDMEQFSNCTEIIVAWAIGGGGFYLPYQAGYPIGGGNMPLFVRMETHFDNQAMLPDIVDRSGLRVLMTPTIREYDAGILVAGVAVSPMHMIPPGTPAFQSDGHCLSSCTDKGLQVNIQAFSIVLHAHKAARAMKLRHFRDGVELPTIQHEPDYDFDYQQQHHLKEEITIMPGDNLLVECVYDTLDRETVTYGGEGTYDEMCLGFIFYYPRQALSWCISAPTPMQTANSLGYTVNADDVIIDPAELLGQTIYTAINSVDWSDTDNQEALQYGVNNGGHISICNIRDAESQYDVTYEMLPTIGEVYVPPENECHSGMDDPDEQNGPTMPSMEYPYGKILSDKYHLFWTLDDETVTFEVHVQTKGWVGFGISPTGGMLDADIMIGWVEDGKATLTDRYATGMSMPLLDTDSQDYHLLSGYETDTHTVLKFWRYRLLCDPKDVNITDELSYSVIWAYGASDDGGIPNYHVSRGSVSLDLVSPEDTTPPLPDDAMPLDLLNNGVPIPVYPTTYWCNIIKIPDMETHHIVAVEPVIAPGSEPVLHHVVIYGCYMELDDSVDGLSGTCDADHMMPFLACTEVMVVWAVGGQNLHMPEHVGYPIGGDVKPLFVRMETHYDNQAGIPGLVDYSGVRIWLTPTLRWTDAGILTAGVAVNDHHLIPPGMTSFRTDGHCMSECMSKGLTENMKVFAVMPHAHQAARGIRLRHFRNGVELPPIIVDDSYDFDYQQTRMLKDEVTIMPIDNLVVECTYNTEDRDQLTTGGEGTFDEMCLVFILYYPRQGLTWGVSVPTAQQIAPSLGYQLNENSFIISPPDPAILGLPLSAVINNVDWSNESIQQSFQAAINSGRQMSFCQTREGDVEMISANYLNVPPIDNPWTYTDACYSGLDKISATATRTRSASSSLLVTMAAAMMLFCMV